MALSETIGAVSLDRPRGRGEPASDATQRSYPWTTRLVLVGNFLPAIQIVLGDTKFTPGRIVVLVLLLPALGTLFRKDRHLIASDLFATMLMLWMIGSSVLNGGFRPYVVAESLEIFGAYLIGRAYMFGFASLQTFLQTFRVLTIVLVLAALADTLAGGPFTLEMTGALFPIPPFAGDYRHGLVRATSTFEQAELYGTFCVAALAIFLYSERHRLVYVGTAIVGTVLSLSSGPVLGLAIVLSVFCYDRILKRFAARWKVLVFTIGSLVLAVVVMANDPAGWIVRHLTFDPATGYWRMAQWEVASRLIGDAPILGTGLTQFSGGAEVNLFVNQSVDCVWLVEALRYGLPAVALLLLTIFTPYGFTARRTRQATAEHDQMANLRTGVGVAIVTMCIVGLTVHFWGAPWIFFGLLIGIRGSFAEFEAGMTGDDRRRASTGRSWGRVAVDA